MISKTKIAKKANRKTNLNLKTLIIKLKGKNTELANLIALPRRKAVKVNIEKLNNETKEDDVVIVPGKVLGQGEMNHAITIAALSFSQEARAKLKNCRIMDLEDLSNKTFKLVK